MIIVYKVLTVLSFHAAYPLANFSADVSVRSAHFRFHCIWLDKLHIPADYS